MNKVLKNTIAILFLLLCGQIKGFSESNGQISGKLILDDSWERRIYVSYIKTFEKEYAVSNDLIITSAVVDSLGNFEFELDNIPSNWSLLRLHVVKKGVTPNSLVIGSRDENYMFLIAKKDSEIKIYNTEGKPIFGNIRAEGAKHMRTFGYIRRLSNYPNSLDYENSLIEKEFIEDVVSEKLKAVADTTKNPLVALYALYQTDFHSDYYENPTFYENFLSKWENENSVYFESFRSKFPIIQNSPQTQDFLSEYILFIIGIGGILLTGIYVYRSKNQKIKKLSIQERKIFELIRNGLSNKEISAECNIELTTVKSHVSSIYSKLNIKSRKEAINFKS